MNALDKVEQTDFISLQIHASLERQYHFQGSKARSFSMAFFGTDDVVEEHPEFPFSARDSY